MNSSNDLLNQLRIDRSEPETGRRGLWIAIAVVALLALLAAGWFVFGRDDRIAVRTAPVVAIGAGASGASSVLDATGYVVARRMATVSAKITGKVEQVLIEEGMQVTEGQVVATLDATEAQAQQRRALAQLEASQAQVREAQAQQALALADHGRQRELADRGLASASALDNALAQRDLAAARLDNARRQVEVARASLAQADIMVDNHTIRTPFAGVVVAKAAQPGEMISPVSAGGGFTRTGIGTVVDMDSLEIEVDVNEAFIGRVKPGMPVQARLNAYPDWQIPAEVIAIIPTADRGKATVRVRVALGVKDERIVPDMGVRVSFLEATPEPVAEQPRAGVLVPSAAIVRRDEQPVAFSVSDDRATRHVLTLGRSLGSDREVLTGLTAGQRVVVDPPPELVDGSAVRADESSQPQ